MSAQSLAESSLSSVAPPVPNSSPNTFPRSHASVEEYLALERAATSRHEYFAGEIIEMAGETPVHNLIAGNIFFSLRLAVRSRPCPVYFENIRLRVSPTQYRYPDVMALCGEAHFDNDMPPALLNPSVIIEVLSPSTQALDRSEKFFEYRQVPSLTDYVLASQDAVSVIHYIRQSDRRWSVTEYNARTEALTFAALDTTLTLAEVYEQVTFAITETPI